MWQVVVTWIQNILIPDTVTGQPQGLDTSNFERKSSSFESQKRKVMLKGWLGLRQINQNVTPYNHIHLCQKMKTNEMPLLCLCVKRKNLNIQISF